MPVIMAIDDNQENLDIYESIIRQFLPDAEILTAQSGNEGLDKANKETPDVVLLDIAMPGMNGYDVCKAFKSSDDLKHIPIIMITGLKTDLESRVKGLEIGADAFLTKPIEVPELVAQIKTALRIKKAEDSLRRERDELERIVQERTRELHESEEKFREIFNNASDAIYMNDITEKNDVGRFLEVNDKAIRLFKFSKDEYLNMSMSDIDATKQPGGVKNIVDRVLRKGHAFFEMDHSSKDGSIIPVEMSCHIFQLRGKKKILCIARDVSERKAAEAEKEHLIRELRKALEKVKILSGMLPICSSCKKIRDDKGYWNQLEVYIRTHSDADFTHSLCPDCAKKIYGDYYDKNDEDVPTR